MASPKCPKCEKTVSEIKALPVPVKDMKHNWNGAVFVCPHCDTILGADLDPLSVIEEIVHRLRQPQ